MARTKQAARKNINRSRNPKPTYAEKGTMVVSQEEHTWDGSGPPKRPRVTESTGHKEEAEVEQTIATKDASDIMFSSVTDINVSTTPT